MRLGVIGQSNDPHCQKLVAEIERRGLGAVLVDTTAFPVTHRFGIGARGCTYDGDPLEDVPVFFLRAVMSPIPFVFVDDGQMRLYDDWHVQYMRAREKHGFLLSWLLGLMARGAQVINAPQWALIGQLKPFHTDALIQAGIPVPPTLMTSDPDEARAFLQSHPQAVYKPVMGGDTCRMVTDDVVARLDVIRHSPVILQAHVPGECIRVTMTDERILSCCRIPSDAVDFRAATGYTQGQTQYEPHELPPDVTELCFRAIRASGYQFTAIDLIRAFPQDYWFLECNYAPAFAAIEDRTGAPITAGIVDYLLQRAESGQPDLRPYPPTTLFNYRLS